MSNLPWSLADGPEPLFFISLGLGPNFALITRVSVPSMRQWRCLENALPTENAVIWRLICPLCPSPHPRRPWLSPVSFPFRSRVGSDLLQPSTCLFPSSGSFRRALVRKRQRPETRRRADHDNRYESALVVFLMFSSLNTTVCTSLCIYLHIFTQIHKYVLFI